LTLMILLGIEVFTELTVVTVVDVVSYYCKVYLVYAP
jgi:hypothetical protein